MRHPLLKVVSAAVWMAFLALSFVLAGTSCSMTTNALEVKDVRLTLGFPSGFDFEESEILVEGAIGNRKITARVIDGSVEGKVSLLDGDVTSWWTDGLGGTEDKCVRLEFSIRNKASMVKDGFGSVELPISYDAATGIRIISRGGTFVSIKGDFAYAVEVEANYTMWI